MGVAGSRPTRAPLHAGGEGTLAGAGIVTNSAPGRERNENTADTAVLHTGGRGDRADAAGGERT